MAVLLLSAFLTFALVEATDDNHDWLSFTVLKGFFTSKNGAQAEDDKQRRDGEGGVSTPQVPSEISSGIDEGHVFAGMSLNTSTNSTHAEADYSAEERGHAASTAVAGEEKEADSEAAAAAEKEAAGAAAAGAAAAAAAGAAAAAAAAARGSDEATRPDAAVFARARALSAPFVRHYFKKVVILWEWYTKTAGATMNGKRRQDEDVRKMPAACLQQQQQQQHQQQQQQQRNKTHYINKYINIYLNKIFSINK